MNRILYSSLYYSNPSQDLIDEIKNDFIENEIVESKEQIANESIYEELLFREDEDWYDFMNCIIDYDKQQTTTFTIVGTLGLWNGRKQIIPLKVDSLKRAIEITSEKDIDDLVIKENEQGEMLVEAYHHDGVNCFTIYRQDTEKNCQENVNFYKYTGWCIGFEKE